MQEEELTRIAGLVTTPDGSSGSDRARPRRGVPTPGGDRLDELSRWWAAAVGKQLPQRVEHFWLPHAGVAGPVRSEVVLHRLTAPRDPEDALDWGVATADDAADDGTDLMLVSIPVHEDDVAWQVAAAQILGLDAVEAAGWPTPGVTDSQWIARVARIRDGLRAVRGTRKDPYALLSGLAHRELMAGTGLLLQAAVRRTPAILDGPLATTCALIASRLAPAARSWWLVGDAGPAGLTRRMLEELRLTAVTELGLDYADGTSARLTLSLLETAVLRAQERAEEGAEDEDGVTASAAGFTSAAGFAAAAGVADDDAESDADAYPDEYSDDSEPDAAELDGADEQTGLSSSQFESVIFEAVPLESDDFAENEGLVFGEADDEEPDEEQNDEPEDDETGGQHHSPDQWPDAERGSGTDERR